MSNRVHIKDGPLRTRRNFSVKFMPHLCSPPWWRSCTNSKYRQSSARRWTAAWLM